MIISIDNMEPKLVILKVVLALLMGGAIGAEREMKNKPAGFITLTLVCMGATMVGILETILKAKGYSGDITRISAQVITGVGFIGGGTILHTKGSIQGLTTAALLWISACLGLVIGYGMIVFATLSFFMIMVILFFMKWAEDRYIHKRKKIKFEIELKERSKINELTEVYSNENGPIKMFQLKWIDLEKNRIECVFYLSNSIPKSQFKKELEEKEFLTIIE